MSRQPSPESTHRSARSSSTWPESVQSNTSTSRLQPTGNTTTPPVPPPESTHCSIRSHNLRSSTARLSTLSRYSQASEHKPLLSYTPQPQQTGEKFWTSSHEPGGHRTESKNSRGVVLPRASVYDQSNWKKVVQSIIGYEFRDVDLLEEALESLESGVTSVGKSHRHFLDGNVGLAKVGERAMKLVLREQCYLFKIPEGDDAKIIKDIIDRKNLNKLGINSKIQQYIRPRLGVRPSQKFNLWAHIKEDVTSKAEKADPTRQIANGIMAIIGAVYFDGGLDSAKRVMAHLGLIIKLPEPKPVPQPEFGVKHK